MNNSGTVKSALLLLLIPFGSCLAHLGEVHPDGMHDFFPDFEVSSVTDNIVIRSVLNVTEARDLVELPDGSGRFLAMRTTNFLKGTKFGWGSELLYARTETADTAGTEGSVSVELHPGFSTEGDPGYGKFYTVTIEQEPTVEPDFNSRWDEQFMHSIVTEWTMTDHSAARFDGTTRELMRFDQGVKFHNVNDLAFGPDGMLYVAVGEDTWGSQARDLGSVYGKILRIDPLGSDSANGSYGIPPDNPFVNTEDAAPEVYAYGMRNPWRINFDRETGALYAGDVGWNTIEEVDLIESGKNYGWPTKEGSLLTAFEAVPDEPDPVTGLTKTQSLDLVDPLFEMDGTDSNTVILGVAYRGVRFPELQGKLIFGSWSPGDIFVGDPETGKIELLMPKGQVNELMNGERYVSINEDIDGEIYLVGGLQIRALFRYPDFDGSGVLDGPDGDLICDNFGSESALYDLNGDLGVGMDDIDILLETAGALPGDLDLNGFVEFADFLLIAANFGSEGSWSEGDANCDRIVDFSDFLVHSTNFGKFRSSLDAENVPEPSGPYGGVGAVLVVVALRQRRRYCRP